MVAGYIISTPYTYRGQARHSNFDVFDNDLITTNAMCDKTASQIFVDVLGRTLTVYLIHNDARDRS